MSRTFLTACDCCCRTGPAALDPLALPLELTAFELKLTENGTLTVEAAQPAAGSGGRAHDALARAVQAGQVAEPPGPYLAHTPPQRMQRPRAEAPVGSGTEPAVAGSPSPEMSVRGRVAGLSSLTLTPGVMTFLVTRAWRAGTSRSGARW